MRLLSDRQGWGRLGWPCGEIYKYILYSLLQQAAHFLPIGALINEKVLCVLCVIQRVPFVRRAFGIFTNDIWDIKCGVGHCRAQIF
jgi:hypothetical protein